MEAGRYYIEPMAVHHRKWTTSRVEATSGLKGEVLGIKHGTMGPKTCEKSAFTERTHRTNGRIYSLLSIWDSNQNIGLFLRRMKEITTTEFTAINLSFTPSCGVFGVSKLDQRRC